VFPKVQTSFGSVDLAVARRYAMLILASCDAADKLADATRAAKAAKAQ
jgi:hypothetical protein